MDPWFFRATSCRVWVTGPRGIHQRDDTSMPVTGCDQCIGGCTEKSGEYGHEITSIYGDIAVTWPCPICGGNVTEHAASALDAISVAREVAADPLCCRCRKQATKAPGAGLSGDPR